jgi:hypothetical protein
LILGGQLDQVSATYWAEPNVRVNALSPRGIYTDQPEAFVKKLSALISPRRMASRDESRAAGFF